MIGKPWFAVGSGVCFAGSLWLANPAAADVGELARWIVRPAVLPFTWQALGEARRSGNADEVFARAQQLLALLPSWTDGHLVLALQFALDGEHRTADPAERARAAHHRLLIAMAWLEGARAHAGRREIELLEMMAEVPEWAARREPGLAELLRPAGGPPAIADRCFQEAERLGASATVREMRTFRAVGYAAALLTAGDPTGAATVLETAIERSRDVADQELATPWRRNLESILRHLRGEPQDLTDVRGDPRMAPLWPHLR